MTTRTKEEKIIGYLERISLKEARAAVVNNSHLTAMTRTHLSSPARWALAEGYLGDGRILDYGCGKGKDAEIIGMHKYDPYYFPEMPDGKFDVVVSTYVANVLAKEDIPAYIQGIRDKLKPHGYALVSVRRDLPPEGRVGKGCLQFPQKLDEYGTSIKKTSRWEMYKILA